MKLLCPNQSPKLQLNKDQEELNFPMEVPLSPFLSKSIYLMPGPRQAQHHATWRNASPTFRRCLSVRLTPLQANPRNLKLIHCSLATVFWKIRNSETSFARSSFSSGSMALQPNEMMGAFFEQNSATSDLCFICLSFALFKSFVVIF